jgi:hypothetical protein
VHLLEALAWLERTAALPTHLDRGRLPLGQPLGVGEEVEHLLRRPGYLNRVLDAH